VTSFSLRGKVALVTGAARGIGFETARLAHERGASVTVLDLDQGAADEAAERIGERTLAIGADVTDADAMADAVERTTDRFGGLDMPVANAGVSPPAATMRIADPDAYERTIEIDLLGVWRTVRPALDQVAARRGHVVVVSSIYAWMNGAVSSAYAISKAGVEQMGRALQLELAPYGAGATIAHFGFIDTVMVRHAFSDPIAQEYQSRVPAILRRPLRPVDAAQGIVDAVERRAPRVILPRWWWAWFALRGIVNPALDRAMQRDEGLLELVRRADSDERSEHQGGLETTAGTEKAEIYAEKGSG
jgi:NAD(P)-dependent dehydrogenase (short-subunit alcohol dehydrogenase family)